MEANDTALPYHEPDINTILVLVSFVLLLNVGNCLVDRILYCGLVAQIVLGVAWATPGADWLGQEFERAVVNLGYLGLLLLVYEGGLLTSFDALCKNLFLSIRVAITGIAVPIGLSYILLPLVGASRIQAFAAGAALCSTSLGSTFSVLSACGLNETRLGTVLTSAAILDDVVGLVMVQVISNLGNASDAFSATTVVRPALVSLAFIIIVPLIARGVVQPLTLYLNGCRSASPEGRLDRLFSGPAVSWTCQAAVLLSLLAATSYAGTSNLLGTYLAGASITWWDREVPQVESRRAPTTASPNEDSTVQTSFPLITAKQVVKVQPVAKPTPIWTGVESFEAFLEPSLRRLLKPFFFASIGFSIPVRRMFSGEVVWKGTVYAISMFLAKFVCGLWLMRLPGLPVRVGSHKEKEKKNAEAAIDSSTGSPKSQAAATDMAASPAVISSQSVAAEEPGMITPATDTAERVAHEAQQGEASRPSDSSPPSAEDEAVDRDDHNRPQQAAIKPVTLYPGCILGSAMVVRGEIGFLIAAIGESVGIFGEEPNGPIYLVVIWAIMLCTMIGPLLVGVLVRRVKRLEAEGTGGRERALGDWGVS